MGIICLVTSFIAFWLIREPGDYVTVLAEAVCGFGLGISIVLTAREKYLRHKEISGLRKHAEGLEKKINKSGRNSAEDALKRQNSNFSAFLQIVQDADEVVIVTDTVYMRIGDEKYTFTLRDGVNAVKNGKGFYILAKK